MECFTVNFYSEFLLWAPTMTFYNKCLFTVGSHSRIRIQQRILYHGLPQTEFALGIVSEESVLWGPLCTSTLDIFRGLLNEDSSTIEDSLLWVLTVYSLTMLSHTIFCYYDLLQKILYHGILHYGSHSELHL